MKKDLINMIEGMNEEKAEAIYYLIESLSKPAPVKEEQKANDSFHHEEAARPEIALSPEDLETMRRIINFMYTDDMDCAHYVYLLADEIVKKEWGFDTPHFNEMMKISAVFQMGKEEGIRQERAKKKAIA